MKITRTSLYLAALTLTSSAAFAQTSSAPAPTATSTTTAVAPAAPATKISIKAVTQISKSFIPDADTLAESSLDAVSYLGASYKLNSYTSIGTRFYVSTNRVAAKFDTDTKKTTEFSSKNTVNDPWLFVTNKSNGIFGSDDISTSLIYYIPNSDLSSKARSNGTLRLDSEIVWTLNPKIQLSYYLNPRQTFIPNGFVTVDGKETEVFARTRLIHGPNFYYNFNDNLQAYVASYLDQSVKSATPGTMDNEKVLNEAGINYVIGKLTLNPAISEEIPTKAKGIASTARYFRDDQTSYNLTAALSF